MSTRTALPPAGGRPGARIDHPPRAEATGSTAPSPAGPDLQSWLLRGGLAFAFAYAAIAMLLDHAVFVRYAPTLLHQPGLLGVALPSFAAYELVLAAGLVLGRQVFLVSLLAALTVTAIVLVNLDAFEILFRNVPIACAAIALALQSRASR